MLTVMSGNGSGWVNKLCVGVTPAKFGETEVLGGIPSLRKLRALGFDPMIQFRDLPEAHRFSDAMQAQDAMRLSLWQTRDLRNWLTARHGDNAADMFGGPNLNGTRILFTAMRDAGVCDQHQFYWGWTFQEPVYDDTKFVTDEKQYGAAAIVPLSQLPVLRVLAKNRLGGVEKGANPDQLVDNRVLGRGIDFPVNWYRNDAGTAGRNGGVVLVGSR